MTHMTHPMERLSAHLVHGVDVVPASLPAQIVGGEQGGAVEAEGGQERGQLEGVVAAHVPRPRVAEERQALRKAPQPPGVPDLEVRVQHDHQPGAVAYRLRTFLCSKLG